MGYRFSDDWQGGYVITASLPDNVSPGAYKQSNKRYK